MRTPFLIIPLFLTGCSHMANDNWSGQDKAQHFLASAMLSAAGNEYALHGGIAGIEVPQWGSCSPLARGIKRTLG